MFAYWTASFLGLFLLLGLSGGIFFYFVKWSINEDD